MVDNLSLMEPTPRSEQILRSAARQESDRKVTATQHATPDARNRFEPAEGLRARRSPERRFLRALIPPHREIGVPPQLAPRRLGAQDGSVQKRAVDRHGRHDQRRRRRCVVPWQDAGFNRFVSFAEGRRAIGTDSARTFPAAAAEQATQLAVGHTRVGPSGAEVVPRLAIAGASAARPGAGHAALRRTATPRLLGSRSRRAGAPEACPPGQGRQRREQHRRRREDDQRTQGQRSADGLHNP